MAGQAQYDMPQTPQGAPPSFYNHAATMQQGAGAAPPADQSQQGQQPQSNADTTKFTAMTDKLLTVLAAMQAMKPNGIDVTKYTQAAADAMKACMETVTSGGTGTTAGTDPSANSQGQAPTGDPTGGGAGAAMQQ